MVGRHDKPRRRVKRTQLKRIRGSARVKSAPIERICVSAAEVKETRQRSRKRAPRWWLAAAKPDLVFGARLGDNWTPALGLHRRVAQRRHGCVWTHPFARADRFPGSSSRAGREGSKSDSERVRPGTSRNAQAIGLPSTVLADILCGVMRAARDPDASTLQDWLVQGAPLGMDGRIGTTGVFPPADKPDKEDYSPTPDVSEQLTLEWEHHRSVLENPEDAHKEFERYRAPQIAVDVDKATLERLFPKGHVNKLGLIVKESPEKRNLREAFPGKRTSGSARAPGPASAA